MRVCFVAVAETTPKYLNMLKALLYSFRKNAGIYKNAPFTVVTNGNNLPEQELLTIQERFSPVDVRTMPRLGSTPFANKFHALYAVDESTYDVLVYIDCDMVILSALDEITKSFNSEKPYFTSTGISEKVSKTILGYDQLIASYANLTENEIHSCKSEDFHTAYPLFNAGIYVLSKKAVVAIRDDAIQICHDLCKQRLPKSFKGFIRFRYYQFLGNNFLKDKKEKQLPQWLSRTARYLLPTNAVYYSESVTEQMGLALALMKNRIPLGIMDRKFNWTSPKSMPNGNLPSVFHYMRGLYRDIDREHLFEGDWIEEYLNSDSPTKKALANIINDYNFESQHIIVRTKRGINNAVINNCTMP